MFHVEHQAAHQHKVVGLLGHDGLRGSASFLPPLPQGEGWGEGVLPLNLLHFQPSDLFPRNLSCTLGLCAPSGPIDLHPVTLYHSPMLHLFFPTRERFAKAFIAELARADIPVEQYDPASFSIRSKALGLSNLHNFHAEFCALGFFARRTYLRNLITSGALRLTPTSSDWSEASIYILPTVKHNTILHLMALRSELDSGKRPDPFTNVEPLGSSLCKLLCFDYPTQMAFSPTYDCLTEHKVSRETAIKQASDNLWERSKENWNTPVDGLWVSPWQDNQDSSRLVLPGLIRQLKVQGAHIALTVNRDFLMVTGADNHAAISAMIQLAQGQIKELPRSSHNPILILNADDTWSDYFPPTGDPSYDMVAGWNHIAAALSYFDLQELVERVLKHRGEDTAVQPLVISGEENTPRQTPLSVWTDTSSDLLATAPVVGFVVEEKAIGCATWTAVMTHAGHCLEKITDLGPDYWRIIAFPSPDVLEKMGVTPGNDPWELSKPQRNASS
jgi:hypothetical protein